MADPEYLTVNDVIAEIGSLHGKTVQVFGTLNLEFEGNALDHSPKADRKPSYESSLWVDFDDAALGLSLQQLREFNGRHVVAAGVVDRDDHVHLGLWPGALLVRKLSRLIRGDA